jgi:hypothetical protein
MKEHLETLLQEADTTLDTLAVHDASSGEASRMMQAWTEPRIEVALRLDYAVEGETPGYLGRRE